MHLSKVQAHILKDRRFDNWENEVAGRWKIEDLRSDPSYCNEWISFDCLAWDGSSGRLYIGLTSINSDIFYYFDTRTQQFTSLGFQRISDKFDAKFHRALEINHDGMIYAAIALLHDMDQQHEARGGKLVRYDPANDLYKILAVPVPFHYIQSIVLDRERQLIYGFTYPAEYLFQYNLQTHRSRILAYIGNGIMMCQPQNPTLDRRGRLWSTWGENRAFEDVPGIDPIRIFSYDPDQDEISWHQHGFPKVDDSDYGRVDGMMLASDGQIYVGTAAGRFCRLDPDSARVEDLGKPFPRGRLVGLVEGPGGIIYGAGNEHYAADGSGEARLFAFDSESGKIHDLGRIYDETIKDGAIKVHMMVATGDGRIFAGENDNILRSSYLWECHVAD